MHRVMLPGVRSLWTRLESSASTRPLHASSSRRWSGVGLTLEAIFSHFAGSSHPLESAL